MYEAIQDSKTIFDTFADDILTIKDSYIDEDKLMQKDSISGALVSVSSNPSPRRLNQWE